MMVAAGGAGGVPDSWADYLHNDRNLAGEPVLDFEEDEELLRQYPDVMLTLGEASDQGVGKLFITSRRVIWLSEEDAAKGYAVPFREVVMHAMSTDPSAFPRPCIYAQLQSGFPDEYDEGAGEEEVGEGEVSMEMRLAPADTSSLEDLFRVFCDAAAMNPDDEADDEGAGEFFFDEAEVLSGIDPATRAAAMARYEEMLESNEGIGDEEDEEAGGYDEIGSEEDARFHDDEEEEEEESGGASRAGANGASG